jgi:uncharacterized protein (DUF433 family)
MIDWSTCPAVERDPDKLRGAWVFKNTRVPLDALLESLEGGATVDEFAEWFAGVERAQVEAALEHARRSLNAIRITEAKQLRGLLLEGAESAAGPVANEAYFAALRRRLAELRNE